VKNRMRELRSCGTVRDEGRKALVYSDGSGEAFWRNFRPRGEAVACYFGALSSIRCRV